MRIGLVAVVLLVAAGCGSGRQAAAAPTVPRMSTKATAGSPGCPLHSRTTADFEACAARRQLELNRRFDMEVAALWPMLDDAGRREFADGQRAWNDYVTQDCRMQAREYLGGSEAPVEAASCQVALTRSRVQEVEGMVTLYCQGKVRTGAFQRCPRR